MKNLKIILLFFLVGMMAISFAAMLDTLSPIEEEEYEKKMPVDEVYGIASYYGEKWNGRSTANMEIYNHKLLTCASPTLPFNTIIEITNIDNKKTIVLRVNDRGPYKMDRSGKVLRPLIPHPKRVLDLSEASFKLIGNLDDGLINIKYKIIG